MLTILKLLIQQPLCQNVQLLKLRLLGQTGKFCVSAFPTSFKSMDPTPESKAEKFVCGKRSSMRAREPACGDLLAARIGTARRHAARLDFSLLPSQACAVYCILLD